MSRSKPRIAFLGTPAFALPSLQMLLEEGYPICGVFTQPDRPRGRGHKLLPPPVKQLAEEAGLPVYQHERISRTGLADLRRLSPDLMVTVAFGQILSEEVLSVPPLGCINVHASLLPKYRGAAPIEWAVINGEARTGVTTMYTVYALDAGDMLEKDEVDIGREETGGELRERLSRLGAATLRRTLQKLTEGALVRTPQEEAQASYYPMFPKGFGQIDFSKSCREIHNLVRGLNPAPVAYAYLDGQKVKIFAVRETGEGQVSAPVGTVLSADAKKGIFVQAGDGALEICRLQFPGGKPLQAAEYMRGAGASRSFTSFE